MKEILNNIEKSVPENLKTDLKKRIVTSPQLLTEFSNQLKELSSNNYDIRYKLFNNSPDAVYFSGDILAKSLYDFWIKGGELEHHFIENAQRASYSYQFECLWS